MTREKARSRVNQESDDPAAARALAVVLHDLAWLLPRTIGLAAAEADPLPLSELEVMRLLARRPGLTVNEVAAELGLQSSNVSTAIRSLVQRGLVSREPDASDGRVVRVSPTAAAMTARDARERLWGESLETVLRGLSASERNELVRSSLALRALADRLAGR